MFNEKGLAMPLAIIIMVVLILLGTTLLFYSTVEMTHVSRIEKNMQAHYLARSGAKTMLASSTVGSGEIEGSTGGAILIYRAAGAGSGSD